MNQPYDLSDPRDILDTLNVTWRTPDAMQRLSMLADACAYSTAQVLDCMANNVQTPGHLIEMMLRDVVECMLFPDPLDPAATWEDLIDHVDAYRQHRQQVMASSTMTVGRHIPWSIRQLVQAAWWFELAGMADPMDVGPVSADSAHRAATMATRTAWGDLDVYVQACYDAPPDEQDRQQAAFTQRWCTPQAIGQLGRARSRLTHECRQVVQQIAGVGSGASAGAAAQANVTIHNHIHPPASPPPVVNVHVEQPQAEGGQVWRGEWRNAAWFDEATAGGLYPELLGKAWREKRIEGRKPKGSRINQYQVQSVIEAYSQYRQQIATAVARDGGDN